MITCERCGKQVPDTAAICPACGTISSIARSSPTAFGQSQPSSISYEYSQGYGQQSVYSPQPGSPSQPGYPPQPDYPSQPAYPSPSGYPPQPGYSAQSGYPPQQTYNTPPMIYSPVAVNVNVMAPIPVVSGKTNSGAVVVEVLLNIFLGIYGVGWLMAGETTTGVILLIASLVIYWPTVLVGSIFTLGLGLFCLIPLAIGGVILNAILLNNMLKRKATYILVQTQTPAQPFPRQ